LGFILVEIAEVRLLGSMAVRRGSVSILVSLISGLHSGLRFQVWSSGLASLVSGLPNHVVRPVRVSRLGFCGIAFTFSSALCDLCG